MYIKKWFQDKVEIRRNFHCCSLNKEMYIVSETEKAYKILLNIVSCDGEYEDCQEAWIPKSCTESNEEHEANKKAEAEASAKRFADGCERYAKLVAFCKENGIKVRENSRKATLLKKVEEAGLEYAY